MNTPIPRYDLASSRHSRLWSNRLWILAGLLGVFTAVHVIGVVHDDRAWRASLRATAQATAEQQAERIAERLQFFASETFAPVTGYGRNLLRPSREDAGLLELASAQQRNERCQCRTTLPVAEFFRVGLVPVTANTGRTNLARFERKNPGGTFAATAPLTDSALLSIARRHSSRPDEPRTQLARLTIDSAAPTFVVVTTVQRDSTGRMLAVYGFAAPARAMMQSLFTPPAIQVDADSDGRAPGPDTLSLQIGVSESSPLYGKLSDDRAYRGKTLLRGPMEGLVVSVALSSWQARFGHPAPPTDRMWALGALSLLTVAVIFVAGSTSRRETFLARARSDFIAGTSHDFRMPLAQILLASETLNLRPEVSSEERTHLGKSIVRETHRLIAMVENVLLFSRSGAVAMKPALQALSVREVFEEVQDAVHLAAEDLRQTIAMEVEPSLQVMADRQLLRQALVNLVDNAMKYGASHQTVTLGARAQSPSLVHVWVDDHGPGIPESQRAKIFEPYERLLRDQASARAGSGLGLAVVSQIATSLRGRVWVEGAPTGGARFVLELSAAPR